MPSLTDLDDDALAAAFASLASRPAPVDTEAHRVRAELMDLVLDERLVRRG